MLATMTPTEQKRLVQTQQRLRDCEIRMAWHEQEATWLEQVGALQAASNHRLRAAFYRRCRDRSAESLARLEQEFGELPAMPVAVPPAGYQVIDDDGEMD